MAAEAAHTPLGTARTSVVGSMAPPAAVPVAAAVAQRKQHLGEDRCSEHPAELSDTPVAKEVVVAYLPQSS